MTFKPTCHHQKLQRVFRSFVCNCHHFIMHYPFSLCKQCEVAIFLHNGQGSQSSILTTPFYHTKFPQLNLIHSFVHIGMLSSSLNLLHRVLCPFVCFSNYLFDFQQLVFNTLHKVINRVGWLDQRSVNSGSRPKFGSRDHPLWVAK